MAFGTASYYRCFRPSGSESAETSLISNMTATL